MTAKRQHLPHKGFTLIEVVIAVAFFLTLVFISLPMADVVDVFRLDHTNQRLYNSFQYARSEALKQGGVVSVCPSADGAACATDWDSGWIVFVNPDRDGVVDTGENVLRVYGALSGRLDLTWGGNNNWVTFNPRGNSDESGTFILCMTGRLVGPIRTVTVSAIGRVRKASLTGDCI